MIFSSFNLTLRPILVVQPVPDVAVHIFRYFYLLCLGVCYDMTPRYQDFFVAFCAVDPCSLWILEAKVVP